VTEREERFVNLKTTHDARDKSKLITPEPASKQAIPWSDEKRLAGDSVIESDFTTVDINRFEKAGLEPVARIFRVVAIEAADSIGGIVIASPTQILHHRLIAGAMRFLADDSKQCEKDQNLECQKFREIEISFCKPHDRLIANNRVLVICSH
jgi:hypothetical protein